MYEPSITWPQLQYSCDACGDLPITRRRWVCERCEDYDLCDACHKRQHKRQREGGWEVASAGESESDSGFSDSSASSGEGRGTHDATHELRCYVVEETMEPMETGKLSACVLNATARWYVETLRLAKSGDANAAALCAQMLVVGYGCNADADEAEYWQQVASSGRARRVEGVYDELP
ncbi:Zinc finger, ZZ-type [Ostreococcus tauri]|uniref:Auxin transport protein n=1 Tax=Ostreococcus tauri TaxID=70448 RepID=Q00W28_OSTTA|nr:Zinc finger, ZZ-type [Ostreococcus tauri]OUS45950.1 auxin transport protein [Ostreococcus tauri]CAL56930.1 Zinc finger, ZZ-type [Ostreococcus tauri]|eukprot:XP_003082975.1 Zinc finger, ZZ-type [Ostreococcus tauri]